VSNRRESFLQTVESILRGEHGVDVGVKMSEREVIGIGRMLRAADPEAYERVIELINRAAADDSQESTPPMTEKNFPA
jgi:hypothetical protein